ncbi:hypothetical protein E2562_018306 [Oryza meyeriana var. granulata]|uniref:non-specific serine/threonine protein kinase n=1 Tax=Oryza meyeriana var. granulata TaxID=110450 RepID=A0A6G1CQC8_9ORYZ|nr:hypothetical protein E2562_018306 [Oryza meyeriana var. granulata]
MTPGDPANLQGFEQPQNCGYFVKKELQILQRVVHPVQLNQQQGASCMTLEELSSATRNFSNVNLIGHGMFGEVYKGLLQDGTIVAIKKRHFPLSHEFIQEVNYLSSIRHRNLVNLLGYCQENGMQMLVYEYVPNGSVSTHLHAASSKYCPPLLNAIYDFTISSLLSTVKS